MVNITIKIPSWILNSLQDINQYLIILSLETNSTCNNEGKCHGNLIDIKYKTDYNSCLKDCKNTTNCAWFTYHGEGKYCTLLDGCKDFSTDCSKCVSGEVSCTIDYQCNLAGILCKVCLLIKGEFMGDQRSYTRWLDRKIYKREMKFWAAYLNIPHQ